MITLTDKGAEKVREFLAAQAAVAETAGLRVGVRGGGCSGFQYALAFDEQRDGDSVFEDKGIRLLVDSQSLPYVKGSTIDFVDGLQGAGFKVDNPNVIAACGCGSSFRVADEEEVSAVSRPSHRSEGLDPGARRAWSTGRRGRGPVQPALCKARGARAGAAGRSRGGAGRSGGRRRSGRRGALWQARALRRARRRQGPRETGRRASGAASTAARSPQAAPDSAAAPDRRRSRQPCGSPGRPPAARPRGAGAASGTSARCRPRGRGPPSAPG